MNFLSGAKQLSAIFLNRKLYRNSLGNYIINSQYHSTSIIRYPSIDQKPILFKPKILDKELDELYDALTTPVSAPVLSGPIHQANLKLNSTYLHDLKLTYQSCVANPDNQITESLSQAIIQAHPPQEYITHVIHLNALAGRVKEAQEAFDLIKSTGSSPDLVAYNHLLDAYARDNNIDAALRIFDSIKENSLVPDLVSYSTLIKALVKTDKLNRAFDIYHEMKLSNILPNRIVFTTLIKGCIKNRDISRAWKTFDYMRSNICPPDNITYSLMIHACSKTQDVERAFCLFEEMISKGIVVTDVTFTSLIQACSSRKDYYLESFNILEQMVTQGYLPTLYTYNTLLGATARQGDIERTKIIWNDMIKSSFENPQLKPNTISFTLLFKAYAKSLSIIRRMPRTPKQDSAEPNEDEDALLASPSDQSKFLLNSKNHDIPSIYSDCQKLWNLLRLSFEENELQVDLHLMDSYLHVLSSNPTITMIEKSIEFMNSEYDKYGIEPSGNSYSILWHSITRNKTSMKKHGEEFWKKFMEWDASLEKRMTSGSVPLTIAEKEQIRMKEHRGRDEMFNSFMNLAKGYTRINELSKAVDVIEESQQFRDSSYLRPVLFKDVWALIEKSRDEAEDGNWDLAKRLMKICARPDDDPVSVVQNQLKLRNMPKHWWGWKSLGIKSAEDIKFEKFAKKRKKKLLQNQTTKNTR